MGRINIREATFDDIPEAFALAEQMHVESDYADIPLEHGLCTAFLEVAILEEDYCFLIAERDNHILGGMIGCISPYYFSSEIRANDVALFVAKEERGTRTALYLVKAFERWAYTKKAKRIYLGVSTGYDKAGEFYERIGYNQVGGLYRKKEEF